MNFSSVRFYIKFQLCFLFPGNSIITNQEIGYLGIRPSGNPPLQKVLPLYEGVGSIPLIFKIYVCVSLD